jgi:hypothetical protein
VPQLLELHGRGERRRPQEVHHLTVQADALVARAAHGVEMRRDGGEEPRAVRRAVDHERLEALVGVDVDVLATAHIRANVRAERDQALGERGSMRMRRDDEGRLAPDKTLLTPTGDDVDENLWVTIHLDDVLAGSRIFHGLGPRRRRDLGHCPLPSRIALTVPPRPQPGESVILLRKSFLSAGAGAARRVGRDRPV